MLTMADATTVDIQEWRQRRETMSVDRRHLSQLAAKLRLKATAMRDSLETPKSLADSLLVEQRILSEHVAWCRRSIDEELHPRNAGSSSASVSAVPERARATSRGIRLGIALTRPDTKIRELDLSELTPSRYPFDRRPSTGPSIHTIHGLPGG
jgi:hypothetical protein